ncbi:MAG TPA: bifunctional [glutamate--ammonia ligase]-adenylyl-L-tyrosine phosphorylase/[glutamate--ammonia-ligase] adenylyltransferase [Polyangia bacterium]|nr:bifunctional [glutamate--ammonia ligase]-adenylyl-L-tyrosine phosphorylase/[glutamate--ammonia-ligase] adenylyltransferase [Polyangia bacterium]
MDQRAHLLAAAAAGPDPEGAPTRIARFCDAAGAELGHIVTDDDATGLLLALASQSPYLMTPLVREPARLLALARDPFLRREKDAATMRAELAACLDEPGGHERSDLAARLRRYRNAEYLRLGARELGWGRQEEVARELAHLADVTLDAALARLHAELVAKHGEPRTADGRRCRFVVFGMGKLGGEELNFSSDIDLVYLYETDQGAAGALTLHEFFARLCERLTRVIADVTDEGFVFRVDLRLRPEGTRGPVCNSLGAAERYYESFGRPWERQAWVKARAVAGDLELGAEAERMLAPFVWPRTAGSAIIRAVHELMARMRSERATARDVKLGAGGIREVEFFTQALQLVHGGRNRSLRERGTLRALDRLRTAGIVSEREHRALADAYLFLRRVEHRLQLAEGRQTHALPDDETLLARRLGFRDRDAFAQALAATRQSVSAIFATLGAPESPPSPTTVALLDPSSTREELVAALGALAFRNAEASADELQLLRQKPHSPFAPAAGDDVARVLLEEVAASPDPDLALRRLVDLVGRRGAGATIWRLVAAHRPLARLLVTLFGTSEFLGKTLVAHPELVEQMLSAASSARVRSREDFDELVARAQDGLEADDPNDEEARLNALRRVRNEEMLRIGLFDVGGELAPADVSAQLTDLADAILEAALAVVAPATFKKWGTPSASLAVIGLGKLGGRELTYASDLDVIFVYSDDGDAFEVMSRLAQRLIHALSAYLDEGRLYEIDTRLRPSGQKGTLVSSLAGFRAYHAKEAAVWERQALIKARTVAGDRALGDQIERLASELVYKDAAVDAREIGRIRARMEKEIAQETAHVFNIKTGRGGLVDVEFLVQYLQLVHGPRLPSLRQRATVDALAALAREGVLPAEEARTLAESYAFLRRLENRLRIVHDRSIQQITDRAGELGTLARRLGYHGADAGARLLADYRAHTERIRALYARYLPTEHTLQDS